MCSLNVREKEKEMMSIIFEHTGGGITFPLSPFSVSLYCMGASPSRKLQPTTHIHTIHNYHIRYTRLFLAHIERHTAGQRRGKQGERRGQPPIRPHLRGKERLLPVAEIHGWERGKHRRFVDNDEGQLMRSTRPSCIRRRHRAHHHDRL